eukprot:1914120-Amphidinium_carterae.1
MEQNSLPVHFAEMAISIRPGTAQEGEITGLHSGASAPGVGYWNLCLASASSLGVGCSNQRLVFSIAVPST